MNKAVIYKIFFGLTFLFTLAFYAHFTWNMSFVYHGIRYFTLFDDTMIPMRYAKNCVSGFGFVYNPHEYVEGFTDFLWACYMCLLHLIPVHESKVPLLLTLTSIALLFANIYFCGKTVNLLLKKYNFAQQIPAPLAWTYAFLFAGLFYGLIFWSLTGLEVGAICSILTYLQYRIYSPYENENHNIAAFSFWFVVLFLLRMDTIIYSGAICFFLFLSGKKRMSFFMLPILSIILTIALLTLFRVYYYHDSLPNTFYLKVAIPLKERLYYGTVFMSHSFERFIGFGVLIGLYCSIVVLKNKNRELWLGAILMLSAIAYSIYVGGDSWEGENHCNRHLTTGMVALFPTLPVLLMLVIGNRKNYKLLLWIVAALLLSGFIYFAFFYHSLPTYKTEQTTRYFGRFGKTTIILLFILISLFLFVLYASFSERVARTGMALLVLGLCWLQINAAGFVNYYWYKSANEIGLSRTLAMVGLEIRQHTAPDTKFGVIFAGTMPYYCNRYCTDLLGKCEKHIAKEPPRTEVPYKSGHMKWDYIYSINTYHPDAILYLWQQSDAEIKFIEQEYTQHKRMFIRKGAENKFDPEFLRKVDSGEFGL